MNIEALKEAHDLSLDGRDFAARQIILDVIANLKKEALAQPEQVKLMDDEIFKIYIAVIGEVYKNPLSNDPMEQQAAISFARAIEAAHGIKE
jgi:hypothetical protein